MGSSAGKAVVVVDDDEFMRLFLTETLASARYECRSFSNGAAALGWLASGESRADLLLSDIQMPGMSGLDLLRTVKTVAPELPFILISGLCDLPLARSAVRAGANDYLLKPVRPADLLGLVTKHVDAAYAQQFEKVKETFRRSLAEPHQESGAYKTVQILKILDVLGFKRYETLQHSRRVAAFALLIGRDLGLNGDALRVLETGSLLHDIGKAAIPHNLLMKPGKLENGEWEIMKLHPRLGLDLLSDLPGMERESQIVYSHHERFDGSGYPDQLSSAAIPLNARVFAIADTLDAIISARCYRPGRSIAVARAEISRNAGTHFDPAMVRRFNNVPNSEFEAILEQFPDAF
jgi:putative nucleotidyltransferase with HDIG domain